MSPDDGYLLISGLQHLVFCEKQWALIYLENLWDENLLTVEGRHLHRNVHKIGRESRGEVKLATDLALCSRRLGIRVEMETEVTRFEPNGKGFTAILSNGRTLEADTAVLSIGVRPDSSLAKEAGLELGARGHIVTDAELRTADPDIYAVGDAIEVADPIFGTRTAIALAGPANRQGRIAAENVLGGHAVYKGTIGASVIKVGDLTAASVGYSERRLGSMELSYHKIYLHPNSNASYYPGGAPLHMKVIFGQDGKLFGAQRVILPEINAITQPIIIVVTEDERIFSIENPQSNLLGTSVKTYDDIGLRGIHGLFLLGFCGNKHSFMVYLQPQTAQVLAGSPYTPCLLSAISLHLAEIIRIRDSILRAYPIPNDRTVRFHRIEC